MRIVFGINNHVYDALISRHGCFALLWINEGGMLTIQVGWIIAEIERLTNQE